MSTKRLSDDDLKALDAEALALDVAGAPGRARAMEIATTVRRDYLQAREDVKLLAQLLRDCATWSPDGSACWCGDGDLNAYCWGNPQGRSLFCIERSVALAEAVRQ